MNLTLNKPYQPIWWAIPFILALSIIGLNSTIDLQLHDTYFVLTSIHIGILFSILLGVIGSLYWFTRNKKLIAWMTASHVIITIVAFVIITVSSLFFKASIRSDFAIFRTVNQILLAIILIMILSQVIFILNLIISLIRNKEKN